MEVYELYDREEHRKKLMAAYKRRRKAAATPELVLVTGRSGVGKTALARSIKTWVEDDWGFFVSGKFDAIQTPHAPFIAAVEEFVKQACLRGDVVVEPVRKAVQQALGSDDIDILLEAIPKLSELMVVDGGGTKESNGKAIQRQEDQSSSASSSTSSSGFDVGVGTDRHSHFTSVFCRFLRAISTKDRNLVLLLDDLQWANASSLEILDSLLNPLLLDTMEGFMVIATCRDNEVSCHDNLSAMLRKIEDRGTLITEIQVQNLSVNALSNMVSNVLDLPTSECLPLAYVIHGQTMGNVFFAKQYIKTLLDEGILARDPATGKWIWDEAALLLALPSAASTNSQLDDLVIKLLARKMKELLVPCDVVEVMKIAACLGTNLSENLLHHATSLAPAQVSFSLQLAKEKGFITYNTEKGMGHWGHDKHREACYSLIPADQQGRYHLQIGRSLRRKWPSEQVKSNILLIVDQIKCGLTHVQDDDERDDFARLFLRAAREAAKSSAFETALDYAELGISLLGQRPWRDQYGLSLDLYSTGTELAYCTGKHDKLDRWADQVVKNARSANDKTRVVMTQIVGHSSTGRIDEGLDLGMGMLEMLEEPFPQRSGKLRTLVEIFKTRRALRNSTEEEILALPELTDTRAMASMQIIFMMFPLLAMRNLDYTVLPAFRLVNLSLKHGLSPIAAVAFCLYGITLVRMERVDDAARFGNLAITIIEKYPSSHLESKVRYLFWISIQTVKAPWRSILAPVLDCHRLALKNGDNEIAMVSIAFHSLFRVYFGDPLDEVAAALVKSERLAIAYGQLKVVTITSCCLQFCKNMQGCAKDPLKLTGDVFNEDDKLAEFRKDDVKTLASLLLHLKFLLAAILNEEDAADHLYRSRKGNFKGFLIPFISNYHVFLRGLVALAIARASSGRARRLRLAEARKSVACLSKLMIHCPDNVVNKIYLLQAEMEFCRGRFSTALLYYDKSIFYAEREQFLLEHALANEKAGIMLQAAGRFADAQNYLTKALCLYRSNGAQLKVDQLEALLDRKPAS